MGGEIVPIKFIDVNLLAYSHNVKRTAGKEIRIRGCAKSRPLQIFLSISRLLVKMIYYTVFAILLCGSLQSSSAFPIDPTKAVQAGIGFITDVIGGKNFQEAASARYED